MLNIQVLKDLNLLCIFEGGKYCVLNMEEQQVYFVILMVKDDYSFLGIFYFNFVVILIDVNDKSELVIMEFDSIFEEVELGQYVVFKKYIQVNGFDVFFVLIFWVNFS